MHPLKRRKKRSVFLKILRCLGKIKIYDNDTEKNRSTEVNNKPIDNMLPNDSIEEDCSEKDMKKNEGSNSTEAAICFLGFSEKGLQGRKVPTKRAIHQKNAEIQTKRRNGNQIYLEKVVVGYGDYLVFDNLPYHLLG